MEERVQKEEIYSNVCLTIQLTKARLQKGLAACAVQVKSSAKTKLGLALIKVLRKHPVASSKFTGCKLWKLVKCECTDDQARNKKNCDGLSV